MIIDSSALLAVILNEADEGRYLTVMLDTPALKMSAANWVETAIVVDRRGDPVASDRFEELIAELRIEIVPITANVAYRARSAHTDFGRGRHPAALNYGDCFSYAIAKIAREPLLFKGNDFSQTDIEPALKD